MVLMACGGSDFAPNLPNPPVAPPLRLTLIQTMDEGDGLYVGGLEGEFSQIQIGAITVVPEHRISPELDLTHEDRILRMGLPRWSPAGDAVLLEVSSAFDQSQLIVVPTQDNSSGARTASPQTQIVAQADWAPDQTRVLYLMSKGLGLTDIAVFITDLASGAVTELPLPRRPGLEARPRWDSDGRGIYYAVWLDGGQISHLYHWDIATETEVTLATVAGGIRDIWRDGRHLLVSRSSDRTGPGHELNIHDLPNGDDLLIVAAGNPLFGHFVTGPDLVLSFETLTNEQVVQLWAIDEADQVSGTPLNHRDSRIDAVR